MRPKIACFGTNSLPCYVNGKFRFLSLDTFPVQPLFPREQPDQAGTQPQRLHEMGAVAETWQESHNPSEIADHRTSEENIRSSQLPAWSPKETLKK